MHDRHAVDLLGPLEAAVVVLLGRACARTGVDCWIDLDRQAVAGRKRLAELRTPMRTAIRLVVSGAGSDGERQEEEGNLLHGISWLGCTTISAHSGVSSPGHAREPRVNAGCRCPTAPGLNNGPQQSASRTPPRCFRRGSQCFGHGARVAVLRAHVASSPSSAGPVLSDYSPLHAASVLTQAR